MSAALLALLDDARVLAAAPAPAEPAVVHALLLRLLDAAADTVEVRAALAESRAGRALLRFTDAPLAIEFGAGEGRVSASAADPKGPGPKVDASAATWLGLVGGSLRPWLAFTRGQVVCRAGLGELRWLQEVAERLQRGYGDARQGARAD